MPEFMDPTTDFGFKKLFGDEANADLTISFLNDLLELNPPLVELSFANLEQLPEAPEQRIGVYDLLCRDGNGNEYLVEMQKGRIANLEDRMVYYFTTRPFSSPGKPGRAASVPIMSINRLWKRRMLARPPRLLMAKAPHW